MRRFKEAMLRKTKGKVNLPVRRTESGDSKRRRKTKVGLKESVGLEGYSTGTVCRINFFGTVVGKRVTLYTKSPTHPMKY